jgi:hypothetical protein
MGAPPPAATLWVVLEFAFLSRENRLQAINDGSSPVAADAGGRLPTTAARQAPHPGPLPASGARELRATRAEAPSPLTPSPAAPLPPRRAFMHGGEFGGEELRLQ